VGRPSLVPRPLLDPSQFFREGSGYETRGGHGCPGHTYGAGPGLCYEMKYSKLHHYLSYFCFRRKNFC